MRKTDRGLPRRIWAATASTLVAVILFVMIIVAAIAGTFVRFEVYGSWWFATLLALFGANLLSCTLLALVERRSRIGSLVTHAGILAALAGAIIGSTYGMRGEIGLSEGQETDAFTTAGSAGRLPFRVRLDDFEIHRQDGHRHSLQIHVDDPPASMTVEVEPGLRAGIGRTGYSVEALRFVPNLFVDRERGVTSLGDDPVNPALQLAITRDGATEKRWVFAAHPDVSMARDDNISIIYKYEAGPVDYTSRVTITDADGTVSHGEIRVNHPLRHRGWALYQAHFNPKRPGWTGLDAVRDPGTVMVFAGIALMNAGVFIVLFRRIRKSRTQST